MNEVIIRIIDTDNNVEGDLELANFNDFPLAITKGIVNLDNLKERTGTFTKTFKVPNTKNNANLLSSVDNINSRKDYRDALNRKPCIILVNDNPIEHGFVQVIKAFNNFKDGYFELVFYGDNIDWVKDANNLKLNTIIWTNNNIVFNQSNIDTINNLTYSSTDIAFPYISRGGNAITDATSVTDYIPCIYVKNLIEKSFNSLGYKVVSSLLTDIGGIVCDLGLNLSQLEANVKASKARATMTTPTFVNVDPNTTKRIIFNDDSTFPNEDENNYYNNTTGIYTVPTTGTYAITVLVNSFNTGADAVGELKVVKNGDSTTSIGTGSVLDIENLPTTGNITKTFNVELNVGDELSIYINPDNKSANLITFGSGTYFKTQLTSEIDIGSTFGVNGLIPDSIKFLDILNDITRMFNIYYWTDVKTKTVYFEPRDNFFKAKTEAIDWSDKLDISKSYNVDYVSSYKRSINFSYKNDSNDKYLEEWNILNKKTYGKYTHELPNRFSKGNTNINLDFFSATYGHKALEVSDDVGFTTLKIWNEYKTGGATPEDKNNNYEPRIFWHKNGTQNSSDGYSRTINVNDGSNTTSRQDIPYGVFETYYDIEPPTPSWSLNFANGLKADGSTVEIGLFERFYSKMFKNIEEGGRVVAYFNLTSTDIQNLDFRDLIYLEGEPNVKGYYLIEKVIDYNPLNTELTKVSLFKFENLGSVSIDGSQTGNNDADTDDGLTPPTLQPIYVEDGSQLIEVYIENPTTGILEPVYK